MHRAKMSVEAFSVQLVGQLGTSHEVMGCPHSIISCLGCIRILTRHVRYHLLPTVLLLRFDLVALVHTSSQERSRRRRHWHSTPTRRRRHFPACPAPADVTLPARRRDGGAPRVGGATALLVRRQSASLPPARRRRHPPAFSRWQRGSYSPACQAVAGVPSPAQARRRLHYPAAGRFVRRWSASPSATEHSSAFSAAAPFPRRVGGDLSPTPWVRLFYR